MNLHLSAHAGRHAAAQGAGVTAVLGPTNTGKTHLAIERLLAHSSGIIGLPLRLLAREVYNRCVERVGAASVALITGEEKIKPPHARYWVSTVEAMPRDLDVAFVAVDEIQLGADLERGHVFTDRMLNRRGREETLVLGAQTMRPMVEQLLPGAHILSRPRLSQLTHAGDRKLTRLPRRSAIVVFSADEVYAIAELIRRQRGGAAVVLGALSPRTRNAQVDLYQSGDVDYLVATDAIGMGLNLDVEHVAFASDRKFDGYQFRRLNPVEFAQIAGRAGRATRDGTFGTTGRCEPFEPDLVRALESHSFEPIKVLQWRNVALDFSSLAALQAALAAVPTQPGLTRAPGAEDIRVLDHAARDEEVRRLAAAPAAVERLWDVCQVPDYRRISPAMHADLVTTLYGFLMRDGSLPADWFARQVALADHTDGDIDTLSTRIAHIRTWTFAANRPDWLVDPEHWQGITRAVEDKLSDALHERLLHRFVDRRTSVLMRRLRENAMLETEISKTGEVLVEGHALGRLEGFRFAADPTSGGSETKALRAAAQKALASEIEARAAKLSAAGDEQFALASDGTVRWLGDAVAKLAAGDDVLRPQLRVIADEHLTGASREAVQARLDLWIKTHIDKVLGALNALAGAADITGIARGVAFQVVEALGVLERQKVADEVKGLDQAARATLRKYGVRFGNYHIYLPTLLKPAPRLLAMQLWALKHAAPDTKGLDELPQLAAGGRTSFPVDKDVPKPLYRTIGYRVCGERAVRVDILERLADLIRPALAWRPAAEGAPKPAGAVAGGGFTITGAMTSLVGSSGEDFASILRALGYRMERKPKPAETAAPATPATDGEAAAQASDTAEAAAPAAPPSGEAADASPQAEIPADAEAVASAAAAVTVADAAGDAQPPAAQTAAVESPLPVADAAVPAAPAAAPEEAAGPGADASAEGEAPAAPVAAEAVSGEAPPAAAEAAEPEMIEVWRPGRFEHRQGPHGRGRGRRPDARRDKPAVAPAGRPEAATVDPAAAPSGQRRGHDHRRFAKGGEEERAKRFRPGGRGERGEAREERRGKERSDGPGRERLAPAARSFGAPRDKGPDPNSPFAKLAALKAQLEGKEP